MQQKFPALHTQHSAFWFLPTYDIDIAWSYLHKGWLRNAGGLTKSMVKSEWSKVRERILVLQSKQADPFDNYRWLDELHKRYNLKPLYFFLVAQQNMGYDKNILSSNPAIRRLIKEHSDKYVTGIHPSWQSGDNAALLKEEKKLLEQITGKSITKSRQHYIRMKLPDTYEKLITAGITEDYSMGYGSINGFRASYCLPFKWYNLKEERITSLTVYPFCFMDANSYYEQHYSSQEAAEEMLQYAQSVKDVDGLFISIWHNHFLGTDSMFEGWREVYEGAIGKIVQ